MLATIPSATVLGVWGHPVSVEVHVSTGLPGFTVVGLPDASCREARDRVRAALLSSGLAWPLQRVTVNLAPTGIPKSGAGLDLAIAVGLLVATRDLPPESVAGRGFVGELGLDGSLRPVAGALSLVDVVDAAEVVVPLANEAEARALERRRVRAARSLTELVAVLRGEQPWAEPAAVPPEPPGPPEPDLSEVRGQAVARLALEVAAAGDHNLLLVGPPGAGKSMLARRLPGVLPDLDPAAAVLATRVHSAAGAPLPASGLLRRPPFRSPHHGASAVALVGGGSSAVRPGEISLATGGVLFLDELGEFAPSALDALRQPLEEGVVRISRARGTTAMPARFLLVAAMNPCPCGGGAEPGVCRCSDAARSRYLRRISGPLLDRLDLRLWVSRPDRDELLGTAVGESSAVVAARVRGARARALERGVPANAHLGAAALQRVAPLRPAARHRLELAIARGRLSARGLRRVWSVGLTLADLAGAEGPLDADTLELALSLRDDPLRLAEAGVPGAA